MDPELDEVLSSIEEYQRLLEEQPDNETALKALGELYTQEEAWPELSNLLDRRSRAAADGLDRLDACLQLGRIAEEQLGDVDLAIDAFKRALEERTDDETAADALERLFAISGAWSELIDLLDRRVRLATNREARLDAYRKLAETVEAHVDDISDTSEAFRTLWLEAERLREQEEALADERLRRIDRLEEERREYDEQVRRTGEAQQLENRRLEVDRLEAERRQYDEQLRRVEEDRRMADARIRRVQEDKRLEDERVRRVQEDQGLEDERLRRVEKARRLEDELARQGEERRRFDIRRLDGERAPDTREGRALEERLEKDEPRVPGSWERRWKADIDAPEAPTSTDDRDQTSEQSALYWNIALPDDRIATRKRILFVDEPCLLRTSISTLPWEDSLWPGPEPVDVCPPPGTTAVPVRFQAEVVQGRAVLIDVAGTESSAWLSDELSCHLTHGTPNADVKIRATQAGVVSLRVTLFVGNEKSLQRRVAFSAIDLSKGFEPIPQESSTSDSKIDGDFASYLSTKKGSEGLVMGLDIGGLDVDGGRPQLTLRVGNQRWKKTNADVPSGDLKQSVLDTRSRLNQQSRRYRTRQGYDVPEIENAEDVLLSFARAGKDLHDGLFGWNSEARGDLGLVRKLLADAGGMNRPRRLQIDSELLPVPWALLYDRDISEGKPIDIEGFWGSRFILDRVIGEVTTDRIASTNLRLHQHDGPPIELLINKHIDSEEGVHVVKTQRTYFERLTSSLRVHVIESRDKLEAYLREDNLESSMLYFFCHGHAATTITDLHSLTRGRAAENAYLMLDQSEKEKLRITVQWMRQTRKRHLVPGRPFVFLNACASAQGDAAFQSLFVTHFVKDWWASGLLGTEWKVPAVFADYFGREVLDAFLREGLSIGQAVHRSVVSALEKRNPFGLMYALYCNPEVKA